MGGAPACTRDRAAVGSDDDGWVRTRRRWRGWGHIEDGIGRLTGRLLEAAVDRLCARCGGDQAGLAYRTCCNQIGLHLHASAYV